MNYWWNENLSGIWATFIWTYSPYLCTGILTAFFNFSFGFWIYSRSLSFCKHLVNLHYKSGLYRGLWVHCHHSLTSSSSQPHPVFLYPSCSAQEGGIWCTETSQVCTGTGLRQVGQVSFEKNHRITEVCGWLSFWFTALSVIPENISVTIPIYGVQTEAVHAVQKLLVRLTK